MKKFNSVAIRLILAGALSLPSCVSENRSTKNLAITEIPVITHIARPGETPGKLLQSESVWYHHIIVQKDDGRYTIIGTVHPYGTVCYDGEHIIRILNPQLTSGIDQALVEGDTLLFPDIHIDGKINGQVGERRGILILESDHYGEGNRIYMTYFPK